MNFVIDGVYHPVCRVCGKNIKAEIKGSVDIPDDCAYSGFLIVVFHRECLQNLIREENKRALENQKMFG